MTEDKLNITLKPKVFVAMSGGVDSSVAALLLRDAGHDVTGVFMRCYNLDGCAEQDAQDARRVAEKLGIPFYVWDFEEEYKRAVVDYMVEGYRRGITPNPDVMCNKEIKFGFFLKKALEMGADFIATGHYVRKELEIENCKLKIARDSAKDQSYFLWTLTQDRLKHCLFPIGDYLKSEVREMAKKAGLSTAEKKDSQGICFLGKITLQDFLSQYIREKKGDVVTVSGDKIGEHKGAEFYTIGQRHNLGIRYKVLGARGKDGTKPHYVTEKDIKTNTVVVAEGSDDSALYKQKINLANVNFLNQFVPSLIRSNKRIDVLARIRYRQPLAKATLISHRSSVINYQLIFDEPQKFVAPGQSAVFYNKEKEGEMLGGGVIV